MEHLEFLNKVELRGVVGRCEVNIVNGRQVANFSLVTEYSRNASDGSSYVETTWLNIIAWDAQNVQIANVQKGAWVRVVGRLRTRSYKTADGEDRRIYEVVASECEVLALMR